MIVGDYNPIKYHNFRDDYPVEVKIRYKSSPIQATIQEKSGLLHVKFNQPASSVTPGQSAVFYENDDVIGGGIIQSILCLNYLP